MNKSNKKLVMILLIVIPVSFLVGLYRYNAYYPLQKIHPKGEVEVGYSSSPNNQYNVTVYRSSGGATAPWTLRGVVHNNEINKDRVIYWNDGENAVISWANNITVIINGKKINVIKGSFDARFDN